MDAGHWTAELRRWVSGRRVIVAQQVAAAATARVAELRDLGASELLVLDTHGTGAGPLPDTARVSLGLSATGMSVDEGIHASNAALAALPDEAAAALDRFDPDRSALVLGSFLNEAAALAGRPFACYRRAEWVALDDKTIVDALWDRVGVEHAPSTVVAATADAVVGVWPQVDLGDGVVLAVDAAHGWTGGAEGTRPVRSRVELEAALAGWGGRRVRVMPFLEG
ncbi:MAG: hypothetical protein ABIR68_14415, partial [Ilumatobacteraceae bacterium]